MLTGAHSTWHVVCCLFGCVNKCVRCQGGSLFSRVSIGLKVSTVLRVSSSLITGNFAFSGCLVCQRCSSSAYTGTHQISTHKPHQPAATNFAHARLPSPRLFSKPKAMASLLTSTTGFPRIGPHREMKTALELCAIWGLWQFRHISLLAWATGVHARAACCLCATCVDCTMPLQVLETEEQQGGIAGCSACCAGRSMAPAEGCRHTADWRGTRGGREICEDPASLRLP